MAVRSGRSYIAQLVVPSAAGISVRRKPASARRERHSRDGDQPFNLECTTLFPNFPPVARFVDSG